jgi:SpoU rRNA methylase family enzyme
VAKALGLTTEELRTAIETEMANLANFHVYKEIPENDLKPGERVVGAVMVLLRKVSTGLVKARQGSAPKIWRSLEASVTISSHRLQP